MSLDPTYVLSWQLFRDNQLPYLEVPFHGLLSYEILFDSAATSFHSGAWGSEVEAIANPSFYRYLQTYRLMQMLNKVTVSYSSAR